MISNLRYVGKFEREHGSTPHKHALGNHGDEGWDYEVGEDAATECAISNAFNAIVKTNRTLKRAFEGKTDNPPE
jgi:hypothetical protein